MRGEFSFILILIVLVFGAFFVFAGDMMWGFSTITTETELLTSSFSKGWNLVYGFADPSFIVSGNITKKDIRAIFVYSPSSQSYVRVYPNPNRTSIDALSTSVLQSPFWVYSNKIGDVDYNAEKMTSYPSMPLYAGWNTVTVTSNMIDRSLNDIKGDCEIINAVTYESKKWIFISNSEGVSKDYLGTARAIKVSSDCTLNLEEIVIQAPENQTFDASADVPVDENIIDGGEEIIDTNGGDVGFIE